MVLSAADSALVAGSSQEGNMQAQQAQPQVQSARVIRSFYFNGKPTKVGETIELPRFFALEMKAANKVAIIAPKLEEKPEPKKPESQPRRLV